MCKYLGEINNMNMNFSGRYEVNNWIQMTKDTVKRPLTFVNIARNLFTNRATTRFKKDYYMELVKSLCLLTLTSGLNDL